MTAQKIRKVFRGLADCEIAKHSLLFFKTGKGEYGEGDKFLGIRVPMIRKQVKKYKTISYDDILIFLKSSYHEERLFALLLLVEKFTGANSVQRADIYKLYLNHTAFINNWDLVDSSAHHIVGAYLDNKDRQPLYCLAKSNNIWERRIAIISTFYFIKKDNFDDALKISNILRNDDEDLIHKAVGWMLREIGKRNLFIEKTFLKANYKHTPRTMLRYAIEKFPDKERKSYLKGEI